jgi:hypothetical protein
MLLVFTDHHFKSCMKQNFSKKKNNKFTVKLALVPVICKTINVPVPKSEKKRNCTRGSRFLDFLDFQFLTVTDNNSK